MPSTDTPVAAPAAALTVDALTVTIGGPRPAKNPGRTPASALVRDVGFSIAAGERVALLGRSGSGKSLTVAAITGSLPPSAHRSGHVALSGHVLAERTGRTRLALGRVALVPQDSSTSLNPLVTVGRQLAIPLRRRGLTGRAARQRAVELLGRVELDPARVLASHPAELSGGQRQRVCIALALACEAALIVADEPTTALDVVTQARVVELLRTVAETTAAALLFVTHDLAVAAQLCDRALVLHDGALVEDAPLARLLAHPEHPYTRSLVEEARLRSSGHLASLPSAVPTSLPSAVPTSVGARIAVPTSVGAPIAVPTTIGARA